MPGADGARGGPLDKTAYGYASYVLLALVFAGSVYAALQADWIEALALFALVAGGLAFIAVRDRLPSLFTLLFVLAGLINALGYVLGLWRSPLWFDELVHIYTAFTVTAAMGWLLFKHKQWHAKERPLHFVAFVTALGIAIGFAWEGFELAIGIIGTTRDTIIDLICDSVGAVAASLFCVWAANRLADEGPAFTRGRRAL